jgi:hypothetical protein
MARRSSLKRERREPNTVQLRATMPSGRTPSVDSAREPAAASFDTDDEAAGRPAQTAAIEQALAHEGRIEAQVPRKARGVVAPLWTLAALVAVAIAVWLVLS